MIAWPQTPGPAETVRYPPPVAARGYHRMRFFSIHLWQLIGMIAVLLTLVLYLFPREQNVIDFFLDRGMYAKALAVVEEMLAEAPDEPGLLFTKARIHELQGAGDQGIRTLEYLLARHPRSEPALRRLATYYEWNRRPGEALSAWERLARVAPDDERILGRLISYYRYEGRVESEVTAVSRLVTLEQRAGPDRYYDDGIDPADLGRVRRDPFHQALTRLMQRIVAGGGDPDDRVLQDELLRHLFAVRHQYGRLAAAVRGVTESDREPAAIQVYGACAQTGTVGRCLDLAEDLDRRIGAGSAYRLLLGRALSWNGLPAEADRLLAGLAALYPRDPVVARARVEAAWSGQDPHALMAAYQALLAIEDGDRDARLVLAELYLSKGMNAEAYRILAELVQTGPVDDGLLKKTLEAGARGIDAETRRQALALVLARRPQDRAFMLFAARTLVAAGDQGSAIDLYRRYLQDRPGDREAAAGLAELYTWTGRPEAAYGIYRDLARVQPDRATVDRMLDLAGQTGNPALLRQASDLALGLRPKDADLRLAAAGLRQSSGDLAGAIDLLRLHLADHPQDASVRGRMADWLRWNGQGAAAAEELGILADGDARDPVLARRAAEAFLAAENLPRALRFQERLVKLAPADDDARIRLAEIYAWAGDPEAQRTQLEVLAARGALPERFRLPLARARLDRGDAAGALALLEPWALREPLAVSDGLLRVEALRRAGRREAAMDVLERLAAEHSGEANLMAELGQQAMGMENAGAAQRFFELCLAADPRHPVALKGSARILAWKNDHLRAIARFEAYCRLVPDDYEALFELGELYRSVGHEGRALGVYRRSLERIEAGQGAAATPERR